MSDADDATLHEVAGVLYGGRPEDFVARRTAEVKRLRAGGDRATAAAVAELRRPTVSAWAANLLVRERGDLLDELLELGAALRAAQAELDAATLRDLTRQRRRLVVRVAGEARALVEERGGSTDSLSAAAQRQVEDTLQAALVDADLAEVLRSGLLVQPLSSTGIDSLADVQAVPGAPRLAIVRSEGTAAATGGSAAGADDRDGATGDQDHFEVDRAAEAEAEAEAARQEQARLQAVQRQRERLERDATRERTRLAEAEDRLQGRREALEAAKMALASAEEAEREAQKRRDDLAERLRQVEERLDGLAADG